MLSRARGLLLIGAPLVLVLLVHASYVTPISAPVTTALNALQEFRDEISSLPTSAFSDPRRAQEFRKVLLGIVDTAIAQVQRDSIKAAINKLDNDLLNKLMQYIVEPSLSVLLGKVNSLVTLLSQYV